MPETPANSPTGFPAGLSGAGNDDRLVGLWLHGKSGSTVEAYRGALAAFSGFTGGKPLRTVTLADLQEYADDLSDAFAPAAQAKLLAAMKSLFSFGHQVGYLPFDVGRPVKLPSRKDDRAERILRPTTAGLENALDVSPHWLRHAHASHAMART